MKQFDKWFKENIDSNKTKLQFTKLTSDDIAIHEDLYINLLVNNGSATLDKKYFNVYREYAIDEVQKSKSLFQKTFG